ncbi:MAG: HYR domain-containing protein, partial [Bacteroidota bacterium]
MKASSSLLFIAIISTFSLLAFSTSIFPLVLEERHISESVIQETKEIQANAQPLQGNKIVLADSLSPCITLSQDSFFCDSEKWTYEFEFSNTSTEDLQQLIVGAFSLLDTVLARDTLFFDPPIEVNDTSDRQQFFIPDSLFLDSVKILLTAYANDSTFCILDTLNFNTSEVCNDSTTCEYFIPCPKDTTIFLEEAFSSTVVTFPTSEDTCGNTIISYSPPSGSIFPCGITTVTRTADDTLNQTSNSCFFDVIVDCIADSICPIPTENLLAFFPLDNQPFDASDSTDNVLFPSRLPSYTTDRNGNINSSALFDRDQAQSIDVQTTSLLDELDEMTLSLWFRVDDLPLEGNNNAMTIISKRDTLEGVPEDVFGLYVFQNEAPNGTLSLISIVNGDLQAANPVYLGGVGRGEALELGEWYCATLKVKNTNPFVELYLDGTLIDQSNRDPGVIRTANQILSIGRKDNTPRPEYFSGAIDEVKIYDRPVAVDSLCCAIIEPPLPPCCEAEIFEQQFNRGFQSIIDSCGIRVRALSLDTCYQVTYDFGDDSDSTRVLGNTSVQHQYAEAGNYTICASVETFDVKDRICQQSDTCWTLCVDCSSCDDPKLINLSVDRFGGSGEELAKAMQLDGDGNIYLTGVFENSLNIGGKILNSEGGKDIFVAKFDPNRRSLWAFSIGGEADDFVNDISIDLSNNVFLAGHFESDLLEFPISSSRPTISGTEAHNTDFPNTTDAFFAKYRPVLNGDIAYDWSYAIGDSGNDRVEAIAVNKEGEIFVGGAYGGNADFDPNSTTSIAAFQTEDAFLAKYYEENGALKFRWQRHWGGEVSSDTVSLSEVKAIEIDEQGAIYLTGAFSGQEAAFDYANTSTDCVGNGENGACTLSAKSEVSNTFITQFQRDGNCNWSYLLEAEGGSKGYALTVDEAYLYTTGIISTASSSTNFDFIDSDGFASFSCNGAACTYVVKYQRENLTYESAFLLETGDSETGLDIEADGRKNIWLSGSFAKERVDFDVRSGPVIQSSGGQDMFIANYDQAGNYINAINPGGSGDDASKAIELASNGDLIFFGNYTSSDLDPIASIDESYFPFNRGSSDLLFARYRSLCPVEVSCPDDVRMLAPLGEDSLIVNFAAPFSSNFCNDNSITASHQSGDLFPCGTTLVTYTSINPIFRDTATCSFNVSVACASQCLSDISCPSDTIILTNQSEITVNYPLPIDTDTCSNLQFTYDLPSGSLFSCDTTSVRFTAVDTLLLDTIICDFDVILECDTLTDCTPNFTCPSDTIIVLEALSSEIEVHYPLPIDSNACENIQFTYDPPSGSLFSCGSTTVAGTAIDTILLDTTFCSFQVLVECDTLPQPSACCQDSLNLNRVAENVFSQRRLNCDTLCFFPVMDSCNLLGEIDWGDGDVDAWNADVDMLNAICHKYEIEASSDFLVCITIAVQEEDSICRQARICETIRVESCEEAVLCECGAWNDFDVNFDSAMASQHACGEAVDVPNCDFEWNISGGFDCLPDTCSASYTWDLRKRGGDVVLSGNGSGNTFDIPIDVSSEGAGIYDFVITSNCGDSACEGCDLTFNVGCEETCACGTFSDIRFGASAENAFALSCNSDPILLECPDEMDEFYQLTGLTACDSDCRMSNLEWSLVSDGEVLLSGNENNTLRGFNFDIPTAAFSASGNYSLFIGGTCGEDACRCRLRFIVPEDCEAESCTCGQFNSLQLVESNGNVLDLECNNSTAYELSCPTRNRAIYFDYACADADCVAAEILTWELTHISSNSIIIGSINLDANADLHLLPLSDSLFEQLGDYRLTLLTNCGEANCTCELLLNNAC